jgi:predicted HTH transcriptional regulator
MQSECEGVGLPRPRFEEIGMRFRVTFGLKPVQSPVVDDVAKRILNALQNGKGLSTQALAVGIGISSRATRLRLIKLVHQGLVREVGNNPQDPTRKYFIARRPEQ